MRNLKGARSYFVLLLIGAILGLFVSCGGGSGPPGGSSPPQLVLGGDWQATFSSTTFGINGDVYGYFSQLGGSLHGNLHFDGSPCFAGAPFTGTVTGNSIEFALTANGQTTTFMGTVSNSGDSMGGNYTVAGGCASGDQGTWSATKIATGQCVTPPKNLVSWWKGEANANDETGRNNGAQQGGLAFVPGVVGQAFAFDGSTAYVNVSDSTSLESINTTESVELWVKPVTGPATVQYLYARRNPFLSESFSVYVRTNGALGMVVKTTSSTTNTGSQLESAAGAVNSSQFQHLAATANTTTGVAKVYLNGEQIPMTAVFGPSSFSGTFASVPYLFIGRREDILAGEGVDGAGYFNGLLDEVTLYSTELDQAQIQFIFHAGNGGKCLVP